MPEYLGGWRNDLEDFDALAAMVDDDWRNRVEGLYAEPEEVSYDWLRIENQSQQGACQGHALTDVGEVSAYLASEGVIHQFSRQAAYIWSQQMDGIRGDSGSTLAGGAKVAMEWGFLPEEFWPYTGKYHTKSPVKSVDECKQLASQFRLKTTRRLRGYDDLKQWLASGMGIAWIGIPWGNGGGGHSVSIPGYTAKKDSKGRNHMRLKNSWGTGWGDKGYKECTPAEVDGWFRSGVVMAGSDMYGDGIKPRLVNWVKDSPYVDV